MDESHGELDERFEAARVKRAGANLEETVQGLRLRRERSAFAVKGVLPAREDEAEPEKIK